MSSFTFTDLKYIDCHSHPHDKKFLEAGVDPDKIMQELLEDGGATIAIGTDYTETEKAINFAQKYENCWCTVGIHPADNHMEIFDEEKYESFLKLGKSKIVGVGECGLDYYCFEKTYGTDWKESMDCKKEIERQKVLFRQQIDFALKFDLPLVIHGRPSKNSMDAYRDVLDILEEYVGAKNSPSSRLYPLSGGSDAARQESFSPQLKNLKGHAHFFVGNLEVARRFFDLGFLMSFDGPITFSQEYDEVIKFLPIESIMIETDSPYAAPTPYRGQTNYPIYVKEVAKKIAELKNLSVEEVLEVTKNNTIKLFGL